MRRQEVTRQGEPSFRRLAFEPLKRPARLGPGRRNLLASEPHIERAGSAMRAPGFLEAEHDRAQVGLTQPLRGKPLEPPALVRPPAKLIDRPAFAGDDDDQPRAARLRMAQEAAQSLMRLGLSQSVQIERRVDSGASPRKLAFEPPFDRRERRCGGLRRPGGRRLSGDRRRDGRPGGSHGIRRNRQGRASPSRDRARDLGPERDLLVAQAPQTLRAGRRLLHRSSPCGRSTTNSAGWRIAPARAPAASPLPKKRSARAAPTIAEPVSCAIMSRRNGWGVLSTQGSSASIQNGRPYAQTARSTAIERSGVSATPAPAIGPRFGSKPSTSLKKMNERLRRMTSNPRALSRRSHALRLASDMSLSAISPASIKILPIDVYGRPLRPS